MAGFTMDIPWYKNAIIYSLDVETFQDSDGDGIGDFAGLTTRLDYLAGLGVTCLWLLPFYPTPNRDNGYDIADYYAVDPRLGSLGDFAVFMHEARERGLRVIVDLVVNHTSDRHRWFQSARHDPRSPYRDYYVWRDQPPENPQKEPVFATETEGIWAFDEVAGKYFLHRFFPFQPDLNVGNPAVREEIKKIIGFWVALGVAGFRVDAAPYLIEEVGITGWDPDDPHVLLREMRAFLTARRGDAILLAEANLPPGALRDYFGQGDEVHMAFNFLPNACMFLAFARQEAAPLARALRALPALPAGGQWANFVRNHDELTLSPLGEAEQDEVFAAFAPEERMRIFGRGIRRRLPPMFGGDERQIALAYSLMFSLPGTPVLRYGEEIGMGDDLSLEGRWSVRTAMQWTDRRNGGFSIAPLDQLIRPAIDAGEYGYQQVNVAAQRRTDGSLLARIERMIRARKVCPELGQGEWRIVDAGPPGVFAHESAGQNGRVVTLHNLAPEPCTVALRDHIGDEPLYELLGDRPYGDEHGDPAHLELGGYGYRWFRVGGIAG